MGKNPCAGEQLGEGLLLQEIAAQPFGSIRGLLTKINKRSRWLDKNVALSLVRG
jgi:hypothetical protein